jgi:transcriptional regulator of acetoin/glycerol metabolism
MDRHIERIAPEVMAILATYSWPGNIRELENLMERSVILSLGTDLEVPEDELKSCPPEPVTMKDVQRAHIMRMLHEAKGVIGAAAARLGVPRSTLFYQMRRLGISAPRNRHAATEK